MPIQTFAFPNYYAIVLAVGKDYVSLLVPNLRFFVVKFGSTCENKADLDEKHIFYCKLSKKLSEAHIKYFHSQKTFVRQYQLS